MIDDPMAGKRFDGTDRPTDVHYTYGGPCSCGAPEGKHHTHPYDAPPSEICSHEVPAGICAGCVRESLRRMLTRVEAERDAAREALELARAPKYQVTSPEYMAGYDMGVADAKAAYVTTDASFAALLAAERDLYRRCLARLFSAIPDRLVLELDQDTADQAAKAAAWDRPSPPIESEVEKKRRKFIGQRVSKEEVARAIGSPEEVEAARRRVAAHGARRSGDASTSTTFPVTELSGSLMRADMILGWAWNAARREIAGLIDEIGRRSEEVQPTCPNGWALVCSCPACVRARPRSDEAKPDARAWVEANYSEVLEAIRQEVRAHADLQEHKILSDGFDSGKTEERTTIVEWLLDWARVRNGIRAQTASLLAELIEGGTHVSYRSPAEEPCPRGGCELKRPVGSGRCPDGHWEEIESDSPSKLRRLPPHRNADLIAAVRAYIDSDDQDRIAEFDAMVAALEGLE